MRYLICSMATHGLLRPAIGVAQALRRRGHTVAFVTDWSMQPLLERAGLERLPCGVQDGPSFRIEINTHPMEIARQARHIAYAVEQFAPDVLVGQELALGPVIAAERHDLPLATLGLATYLWPKRSDPTALYRAAFNRHAVFVGSYTVARELFAMPPRPIDPLETPLIGELLLLRSVPELEGDVSALPAQVAFVGDCDWDLPTDDAQVSAWVEQARAAGRPIIYAQPGRDFEQREFWSLLVQALDGRRVRVAASLGRSNAPETTTPANFLVRNHLPQDLVLPYAQAVIASGTTTAVLGALTHGLPLLLIPGGDDGEQEALTERCMRAGVAHRLTPEGLTIEQLRAALMALSADTTVRRQTRQMQARLREAGGSDRAAQLLEEFAAWRCPRAPRATADRPPDERSVAG